MSRNVSFSFWLPCKKKRSQKSLMVWPYFSFLRTLPLSKTYRDVSVLLMTNNTQIWTDKQDSENFQNSIILIECLTGTQ